MNRLPKTILTLLPTLALALAVAPSPVSAVPGSDLATTVIAPATHQVNDVGRYEVRVTNVGNQRSGSTVNVTIDLPRTNTSPTVSVMGTLISVPGGCTLVGTQLRCTLPRINANAFAQVFIDLRLPYSANPIVISATATTSNDGNPANNTGSVSANLSYYAVAVSVPVAVSNSHCTGTNLSSYFECTISPGSVSSHPATFLPGGAIDLGDPSYGGTWAVTGADLTFSYTELGQPAGSFVGKGTSLNCWEGKMTFPGSTYMAMYKVCF